MSKFTESKLRAELRATNKELRAIKLQRELDERAEKAKHKAASMFREAKASRPRWEGKGRAGSKAILKQEPSDCATTGVGPVHFRINFI